MKTKNTKKKEKKKKNNKSLRSSFLKLCLLILNYGQFGTKNKLIKKI